MILLATALAAGAADNQPAMVTSAPLIKASDLMTKNALLVTSSGVLTCPAGFEMYVRRIRPAPTKNEPLAQGDFDSFFHVAPGALLRNDQKNQFQPACFKD